MIHLLNSEKNNVYTGKEEDGGRGGGGGGGRYGRKIS
jgi:hypothetical protein